MTYPTNVEVKNLGYSLKNIIPIPTKQHYLKYMIGKVESFITRLRWKAYFFEKPDQCNSNNSTNFGFESNVTPPQSEKLTPFKNGLYDMVWSIKFKSVRNNFQSMLKEDLSKITSSRNFFVFADKATKLKWNATRSIQKVTEQNHFENILQGRFQCQMKQQQRRSCDKRPAFITLKYHKENFKSNQKCRLINASKSEMGIVSKKYLENIISKLISKFQYNQWRSTSTVIEWFKAIKNKTKCWFIKFGIAEFYPLIAMEQLDRSISFAKS